MKKTFYITKYALTTGIMKIRGELREDSQMVVCGNQYFHGNEWHQDMESAEARVSMMVTAKIKSLRKQTEAMEIIRLHGAKLDDRTAAQK